MVELVTFVEDGKYSVFSTLYGTVIFEGTKEEVSDFIDNYYDELLSY